MRTSKRDDVRVTFIIYLFTLWVQLTTSRVYASVHVMIDSIVMKTIFKKTKSLRIVRFHKRWNAGAKKKRNQNKSVPLLCYDKTRTSRTVISKIQSVFLLSMAKRYRSIGTDSNDFSFRFLLKTKFLKFFKMK